MSQTFSAIYEDGVFRPLTPVDLPNQAIVDITLSAAQSQKPVVSENGCVDLERELDALTFEGPSLPSTFSREDIYFDHD
jgi:predicted DNA-binding antitoxin AbrB/MazE fold protein